MASSAGLDDLLLLLMDPSQESDTWEPGFEVGRCLVHAKAGPYERIYLRPPRFRRRFFHRLYPLPVDTWEIDTSICLFGGLCTIEAKLRIRFQATLRYAEKNPDAWEDINASVRAQMETLVLDVAEAHLTELESGEWIGAGLNSMEKRLAMAVNEMLTLNHVQCRTLCFLKSCFAEISELDRRLYLKEEVVKAIADKQAESEQLLFRTERQRQEEQLCRELEQIRFTLHGSARKQAEEAEGRKRRLEEKRRQLEEIQELEAQVHQQKLLHRTRLDQDEISARKQRLEEKQQRMEELREIERKLQRETLQHQSHLEQVVGEKQRRDAEKREALKNGGGVDSDGGTEGAGSEGDDESAWVGQVLRDLEWEAARKLQDKEQLIASLEARLRELMSDREAGNQMTVGHSSLLQTWLDQLAQLTGRLMFFFRVRK